MGQVKGALTALCSNLKIIKITNGPLWPIFFHYTKNTQVGENKWQRNRWVQVLCPISRLKKEPVRAVEIPSLKQVQ